MEHNLAVSDDIKKMRRFVSRENPFVAMMLIGGFLTGPLLAYGLPADVLTTHLWAQSFADFMARLIPSIERLTEVSMFPEVTRLYMSLQWGIWGPVCAWLLIKFGQPTEEKVLNMLRVLQARWWYVFFIPPLAVAYIWFCIFFPFPIGAGLGTGTTPFDQGIRWISESRLWLGIFGSLSIACVAMIAVGLFKSYTLIRLAYRVRELSPFYKKTKAHK